MTYEEIEQLKKEEFADIVKRNIREKAFDDLMNTKKSHTKLDNIHYSELKTQDYLLNNTVESWIAKDIFKFRTRMIDVHENFKNNYFYEVDCPLCHKAKDKQSHLITCEKLKGVCQSLNQPIEYMDIFSKDTNKI